MMEGVQVSQVGVSTAADDRWPGVDAYYGALSTVIGDDLTVPLAAKFPVGPVRRVRQRPTMSFIIL